MRKTFIITQQELDSLAAQHAESLLSFISEKLQQDGSAAATMSEAAEWIEANSQIRFSYLGLDASAAENVVENSEELAEDDEYPSISSEEDIVPQNFEAEELYPSLEEPSKRLEQENQGEMPAAALEASEQGSEASGEVSAEEEPLAPEDYVLIEDEEKAKVQEPDIFANFLNNSEAAFVPEPQLSEPGNDVNIIDPIVLDDVVDEPVADKEVAEENLSNQAPPVVYENDIPEEIPLESEPTPLENKVPFPKKSTKRQYSMTKIHRELRLIDNPDSPDVRDN